LSVASLPVGSSDITVSYCGDGNFLNSVSVVLRQVVNKAATSTNVISSANPSVWGQSIDLTASVSVTSPGAGTPTGSVTFSLGGAGSLGIVTLTSAGQATLSLGSLPVGTDVITVSYSGDVSFLSSISTPLTQVVNKAATEVHLTSSDPVATYGETVNFTVSLDVVPPGSGTPTGSISFYNGAYLLQVVAVVCGKNATISVRCLTPGVYHIKANYSGDSHFLSSSDSLDQTIKKAPGQLIVTASVVLGLLGQTLNLNANLVLPPPGTCAFFTGTISYTGLGQLLGTVTLANGAAPPLLGLPLLAGLLTATASYSGDNNYNPVTNTTQLP